MEQKENLVGLEGLMNEFFAPSTGNQRKQEIEKILLSFSSQEHAWRDCLFFINNTENQYVSMYCLTTVEQVQYVEYNRI